MSFSCLRFEVCEGIAYITFHRPHRANAIDLTMAQEFMQIIFRCDEDPQIRVVVIRGQGNFFSPGGDLKSFVANRDNLSSYLKELMVYLNTAVSRLNRARKPVIASVNGIAAGSGMSIVCACDMVIASESARFTTAYTRAGLVPDASLSYFLPRIVGLRRALELTYTNRSLSAIEAKEWGIVNQVVPDGELVDETEKLAKQLASGPTKSLGVTKRLIYTGFEESLETHMEHETESIVSIVLTEDAKEGISAFIEKRNPCFQGK
ncbi:enoyl-CoA hydratase-related protein [Bacillaceae bacterium]